MWSNEYFNFTRKDRVGLLFLVLLILFTFLLPGFFSGKTAISGLPDTAWVAAIRKLEIQEQTNSAKDSNWQKNDRSIAWLQYDKPENSQPAKGILTDFDPNTISAAQWKAMGLREKTITTILHFLDKGGRFRTPEDLQRIYGLSNSEYQRLFPFIKIKSQPDEEKNFTAAHEQFIKSKPSRYSVIDINTSDTAAWIALPGIGSKLAARIVNFREKLGGFYSVSQVAETYGLADSVYQKISQYLQLNNAAVRKININTATLEELKAHPYIRHTIAAAIIAYRNEHGLFSTTEDLKKIMLITADVYAKITSYISI